MIGDLLSTSGYGFREPMAKAILYGILSGIFLFDGMILAIIVRVVIG